jgi:hypothetical protein
MYDARFQVPSTFLCAGSSQSGKTTFVLNLIRNIDLLFVSPSIKNNVLFYYKHWQDSYDQAASENLVSHWVNKYPSAEDVKSRCEPNKNEGSLVVIDDFANDVDKDMSTIFSVVAHHTNSVIILLSQSLFNKNPIMRTVSLNSTYIVIFKNPRDASQISHFARQFAPGNHKYVVEAFKECTKEPYTYMCFDHHQNTPDEIRIRSHILPHQAPMRVWKKANV